jgi:hypothetical protein
VASWTKDNAAAKFEGNHEAAPRSCVYRANAEMKAAANDAAILTEALFWKA